MSEQITNGTILWESDHGKIQYIGEKSPGSYRICDVNPDIGMYDIGSKNVQNALVRMYLPLREKQKVDVDTGSPVGLPDPFEINPIKKRNKQPCPLCGQETPFFKEYLLCDNCLKRVDGLRKVEQTIWRIAEDPENILVSVAEQGYSTPYIPHDKDGNLRQAVYELAIKSSCPTKFTSDLWEGWSALLNTLGHSKAEGRFKDSRSHGATRIFTRRFWSVFKDFYTTLQQAMRDAYAEGLKDGANWLRQLASGEITVDQLNEHTTKKTAYKNNGEVV